MLLNSILMSSQKLLSSLYNKSVVLKNIDWLIFANIILVILLSGFAPSDHIGYFALFSIVLTAINMMIKPGANFQMATRDKFLLLYFFVVLISVAGSSLLMLSLKGFLKTITYIGFYISVVQYLRDNRSKLKYILLSIALVVFVESFVAIKQNFLSVSEISGWQDISHLNPEDVMTRVYGSLKPYNPNLFGGYLISALPSTLLLIFIPLMNKHYKTSIFGLFVFILSVISVLLTGCRGAYVALFTELIILAVLTYRFLKPFYRKIFTVIAGFVSMITALGIIAIGSLRARVFSIFAMRADSSNSFRFNVYQSSLAMFRDNWLLGIGVGNQNFREVYGLYMKTGFDALSTYNIYLEIAVESGIFALITFLGFVGINIVRAVRYIYRRCNANSVYLMIAIISIIGMLVHGFVDTVFFRPQIQFIFWIMVAIIRTLTAPRRLIRVRN